MRLLAIVITLIGLLALPAAALAQLSPITQFRNIETFFEVYDSSEFPFYSEYDYAEANDMNLFQEDINLVLLQVEAQASHFASQQSSIEPTRINVLCETYAFNEILEPQWFMYGSSASYCEIDFNVSESVDWTLTGFAETEGFNGGADFQIYDDNGNSVVELYFFDNGGGPIAESGSLEPGDYSLYASTYSDAEAWDAGINMQSSALLNTVFEVSAGMSPVGDPLAAERYLRAGPNPMSDRTMIAFAGAPQQTVQLDVFDIRGRLVKRLADGVPSEGQVGWDGRDQSGRKVPQGTYFLRMRSGTEVQKSKVLILR